MSRDYPQMKLRMPPELKDQVEESAKANGRSMNAEIIHRLEQSFESSGVPMDELPTPEQAREQAAKARASLKVQFRNYVIGEIRKAIQSGYDAVDIEFDDYIDEDALANRSADALIPEVIDPTIEELRRVGYEPEVFDYSSMTIRF